MKKIVAIGSSNNDLVIKCERIPEPGERVTGGIFIITARDKGANQAVAVSRLGGDVVFSQMLRQNYMSGNIPSYYIIGVQNGRSTIYASRQRDRHSLNKNTLNLNYN